MSLSQELVDWEWVADHAGEIWAQTAEHVQLTALAVAIGFVISLPLGIVAQRRRILFPPIAFVTGVLYTIPSLALFVTLIPWTGLSRTTALIGLVSYTLLILIRNVVAGLDGVPEDVRSAAIGMGYGRRQILWRVDLPLALPVVFAGIRLATVTTIGLVTVAALIGQGGLGQFILRGLRLSDPTQTLVGAGLSVVLAVVADLGLLLVLGRLTPWAARRRRGVAPETAATGEVAA